MSLREAGEPCWLMDLDWAIRNLPNNEKVFLPQNQDLDTEGIEKLLKTVRAVSNNGLRSEIDSFSRLALLRNRVEPTDPEKDLEPSSPTLHFRHYLHRVSNHRHRRSLTRLLCGNLVPTIFRASPGRLPKSGDDFAVLACRACKGSYERPEHVLLQCSKVPGIVLIRNSFLASLNLITTGHRSDHHALELLKSLIFSWDVVIPAAKFISDVLAIWMKVGSMVLEVEESDSEEN
ncbi:hypothetical protein VKT23_009768 [Stygiomarasmius scandens]|uniref:Reverse transcriptase zinc-binding domain-containing protein n=1 Tax=Marasmiellus scandens TaxID=2682957 RepID=A0ABR1JFX9_9AGAR